MHVVMSNPWVVRALLSDARKLKTRDSTSYRGRAFDFTKTYISKDMTKAEQDKHRLLILELKNKIIHQLNGLSSLEGFRMGKNLLKDLRLF